MKKLYDGKFKSHCRAYRIWQLMKRRCTNCNDSGYYAYGGRGIKICDEWLHSSEAFMDWAYANGYSDNLEIDRIDPDGNYEPSNCRWITHEENAKRKRKPYSLPESHIKQAHKVWEYCKAAGCDMSNFPEPKYSWQK